jgi:hypothetical protein
MSLRIVVGLVLLMVGCGRVADGPRGSADEPGEASPSGEPTRYEATAIVLESEEHGPMLCLGGVLESLPPQCGDVPLSGWDWNEVPGERSMAGTTWGEYHVVGTYDGGSLTVVETGPPLPEDPPADDEIDTPCPEPAGGWTAPDPGRTSESDRDAARRAAEAEPDFSGLWIDYDDPTPTEDEIAEGDPAYVILTVAFTWDVERHTAELRELWGGPLCVVQHERSYAELREIQKDLEPSAEELGIQVLWSSTDVVDNVVEVGVVVIDEETRRAIDVRYGQGAVRVFSFLTPVE